MKNYLGVILFFLLATETSAQENQINKTYQYLVVFIFISGDSVGSETNFKWYNSNYDTVSLVNHFNSHFIYPEFGREEEIDGSFYYKFHVDSIGKVTTIVTLKGIMPCSNLISKQLQKILWMGLLVDRKKYPFEYFVLKIRVNRIQN